MSNRARLLLLSICAMSVCLTLPLSSVQAQSGGEPQLLYEWALPAQGLSTPSVPYCLAFGPDRLLYVTDQSNGQVLVYQPTGQLVRSWQVGTFPIGIAVSAAGVVYVTVDDTVRMFSATGIPLGEVERGFLISPRDLDLTPAGDILVADPLLSAVVRFSSTGHPLEGIGVGAMGDPIGVVVGSNGHIYVTDEERSLDCVWHLSPAGEVLDKWGGPGQVLGRFGGPGGLAVTDTGELFVADHLNGRIVKMNIAGGFISSWLVSAGPLGSAVPLDVAADGAGRVYVSEPVSGRIMVYGNPPVPTNRVSWAAVKQRFR